MTIYKWNSGDIFILSVFKGWKALSGICIYHDNFNRVGTYSDTWNSKVFNEVKEPVTLKSNTDIVKFFKHKELGSLLIINKWVKKGSYISKNKISSIRDLSILERGNDRIPALDNFVEVEEVILKPKDYENLQK